MDTQRVPAVALAVALAVVDIQRAVADGSTDNCTLLEQEDAPGAADWDMDNCILSGVATGER